MLEGTVAIAIATRERATRARAAAVFERTVCGGVLLLLVFSAVPYGTAEPWWKAAFVSAVFLLAIVAIVETLISGEFRVVAAAGVVLSMLALSALAFVQTISLNTGSPDPGIAARGAWNAISADPYQTRFFVLQLLALTILLLLLYRYFRSPFRVKLLIHVILTVGVGSAVFGLLRQTVQHDPGFVLPRTMPGQGYGQFINKNHFAFLMEMTLGLGLGMLLVNARNRDRMMVYVALLLPIWLGLVLSNSRGGILAMLSQIAVAAILLTKTRDADSPTKPGSRVLHAVMLVLLVGIVTTGTIWVGGDRLLSSLSQVGREFTPESTELTAGVTRNEIWRATWKMFTAHPLIGVGMGGYWVAITAFHDASGVSTPQEAHNEYLELLSSGGLVGFALGIWFGVALFRCARANLHAHDHFQRTLCFGAVIGITGIAVHSLFDFGLHLLTNAFVFMVLIMLATRRVQSEV
jgi:O-antigen ligase